MLSIIVASMVLQSPLRPLDAFLANYSAIKVEMDFEYDSGQVGANGKLWNANDVLFIPGPSSEIHGRWACDGIAESCAFSSTDVVLEQAKKGKPQLEGGKAFFAFKFVPKVEALWDKNTLVYHCQDPVALKGEDDHSWKMLSAWNAPYELGVVSDGRTPFYWGISYNFPQFIKSIFDGITPTRRSSRRNGIPVEVEIYRKTMPDNDWSQFEVSYDASVGHLPRFVRTITHTRNGDALIKEMYLVQAQPCEAGGFVPTEWFSTFLIIEGFDAKYPMYNDDTLLTSSKRVGGGHFVAKSMRTRQGAVTLTDLKSVRTIGAAGEAVPLPEGTKSLTLDDVRTILGDKLQTSQKK